jgi:hypothetical protein
MLYSPVVWKTDRLQFGAFFDNLPYVYSNNKWIPMSDITATYQLLDVDLESQYVVIHDIDPHCFSMISWDISSGRMILQYSFTSGRAFTEALFIKKIYPVIPPLCKWNNLHIRNMRVILSYYDSIIPTEDMNLPKLPVAMNYLPYLPLSIRTDEQEINIDVPTERMEETSCLFKPQLSSSFQGWKNIVSVRVSEHKWLRDLVDFRYDIQDYVSPSVAQTFLSSYYKQVE